MRDFKGQATFANSAGQGTEATVEAAGPFDLPHLDGVVHVHNPSGISDLTVQPRV